MEEIVNRCKELTNKTIELSKEMERALVALTKEAGGKIDTGNDGMNNDPIFAYVWDEIEETYIEKKVVGVEVEDNHLIITLDYGLSTEEECKYSIFGGLVLIDVTLYNLCECLWEYVDIK